MEQIPASRARNQLGPLIASLGEEPVAIERYGKPVAYLVPVGRQWVDRRDSERREARSAQARREQERLVHHLRIALQLVSQPEGAGAMIRRAKAAVDRWERERLCSRDYIERWRGLLALPAPQLAEAMCGDAEGWGTALRQNSPWL